MKPQWIRYALVGIVCVAVGALSAHWLGRPAEGTSSASDQKDASAKTAAPSEKEEKKKKPGRRRKLVQARSRNPTMQQLQALGYVDGTYDPKSDQTDVVLHEPKKTSPGYNFYASRKQTGARLIDMKGRELHSWHTDDKGAWQHAELLPNGDVIVIVKDKRLTRYDKDTNSLWSVNGRFHHDLWVVEDEIYVLARVSRVVDYIHPRSQTLVDVVQVRSLADGELERQISLLDALQESPYRFLLPSVAHQEAKKGNQLDVLHTNHVEVFDGRLAKRDPIYAKGNILISIRNTNSIAILDGKTSEVVWIWGPTNLTFQHHPTLLDNGNILLFDNGLKKSRIVEVDPLSGEIEWQYAPDSGFFSKTRGSNQRLPNGNTLITESDRGYVFEVTPEGKVVWKFANPIVHDEKREAIWRMTRFDPDALSFVD